MIHIFRGFQAAFTGCPAMFADRKVQFVDTLRWQVPVVADRYEIDQFDTECAVYIVAIADGGHLGSMRLLPTADAHILGSLYPHLSGTAVPCGAAVFEITRLCLPSRLGASGRRAVRDGLILAMVDLALAEHWSMLTGVVSRAFRAQVLLMGWRAQPLGAEVDGLAAFRIDIDVETPALLAAAGVVAVPSAIAA